MNAATEAHYPGRAPIDAYGNGGFRFAEMSHLGSLQILPSGIYAWEPEVVDTLGAADFSRIFAEAGAIEFVLLGSGDTHAFPPPEVRTAFEAAGIGLEVMGTGAACRTYNVLFGEGRDVAAALIAVD